MKIDNKMKTIILLIVLGISLLAIKLFQGKYNYTELKLIIDDKENNYFEQNIPDSLLDDVRKTLIYYDISFKEKEGKLYIPKEANEDKEFIKNISSKSKDKAWLESIGK